MARSPNCTGAPLYKGRVDVSITYPDPDIVTLDTPEALPTSEPATAQVSMTVASGHMPVWSPVELEHTNPAFFYAAGKNTGGDAITVYYRTEQNGSNVATGSQSIPAGEFYTWTFMQFRQVATGDILTCRLWGSANGLDVRKKALAIYYSRVGPKGAPLAELLLTGIVSRVVGTAQYTYEPSVQMPEPFSYPLSVGSDRRVKLWLSHSQYGVLHHVNGDRQLSALCSTHATNELYTAVCKGVTRISYTPLNLRV